MDDDKLEVKFHFFSLKFTPTADNKGENSQSVFVKAIDYLQEKKNTEGKYLLLDRHVGQKEKQKRELFLYNFTKEPGIQRFRCSLALLRPKHGLNILKGDQLVSMNDEVKNAIAELSHFYVDYSTGGLLICCQFNYYGPRMSDIEWYFRQVAQRELKLVSKTKHTQFVNMDIRKALDDMKEITSFEIKIIPRNFNQLDNSLKGEHYIDVAKLATKLRPRFMKVESSFYHEGNNFIDAKKSRLKMVKDTLRGMSKNSNNIDCFDNFEVSYLDSVGVEHPFKLFGDKNEVKLEIDPNHQPNNKEYRDLIYPHFDTFIKDRSN